MEPPLLNVFLIALRAVLRHISLDWSSELLTLVEAAVQLSTQRWLH